MVPATGAAGGGLLTVFVDLAPLQANRTDARNSSIASTHARLVLPALHPGTKTSANGNQNPTTIVSRVGHASQATLAVVAIVRFTVAGPLWAVSVPGEKEQLAPRGRLAQENERFCPTAADPGLKANAKEALCPALIVAAAGEATNGPAGAAGCAMRGPSARPK